MRYGAEQYTISEGLWFRTPFELTIAHGYCTLSHNEGTVSNAHGTVRYSMENERLLSKWGTAGVNGGVLPWLRRLKTILPMRY